MFSFESSHISRIRLSMAALGLLLGLGIAVLATTYTAFDTQLRVTEVPRSMIENKALIPCKFALPLFMIFIGIIGIPLYVYVAHTLAMCEKKAQDGT